MAVELYGPDAVTVILQNEKCPYIDIYTHSEGGGYFYTGKKDFPDLNKIDFEYTLIAVAVEWYNYIESNNKIIDNYYTKRISSFQTFINNIKNCFA